MSTRSLLSRQKGESVFEEYVEQELPPRPESRGAFEALEAHLSYNASWASSVEEKQRWIPRASHVQAKDEVDALADATGAAEKPKIDLRARVEAFLQKSKKKKGHDLNPELQMLQYLFTNSQTGAFEHRGLTRGAFKAVFSRSPAVDMSFSRKAVKTNDQARGDNVETGMLLDDMFAVLDKTKQGFISIDNILQFMFRYKDKKQRDNIKKHVMARNGEVVYSDASELPALPQEKVEELQEIYHTLCSNSKGVMSESEFETALRLKFQVAPSQDDFQRYWSMADSRKRGYISERDFIDALQNVAFVHFEDINKGVEHHFRSRSSSTHSDPTGANIHQTPEVASLLTKSFHQRRNTKLLSQSPGTPLSGSDRLGPGGSFNLARSSSFAQSSVFMLDRQSSASIGARFPLLDAAPPRSAWRCTGGGRRTLNLIGNIGPDLVRPRAQQCAERPRSLGGPRPHTSMGNNRSSIMSKEVQEEGLEAVERSQDVGKQKLKMREMRGIGTSKRHDKDLEKGSWTTLTRDGRTPTKRFDSIIDHVESLRDASTRQESQTHGKETKNSVRVNFNTLGIVRNSFLDRGIMFQMK